MGNFLLAISSQFADWSIWSTSLATKWSIFSGESHRRELRAKGSHLHWTTQTARCFRVWARNVMQRRVLKPQLGVKLTNEAMQLGFWIVGISIR